MSEHNAVNEIGTPDKVGDKAAVRVAIDLDGRADLFDQAFIHDDDPVRKRHRLDLVVGDIDAGDVQLFLNTADLGAHLLAQLCIQVGERLVHQQDLGLHDQGARQRDALLLSAGELARGSITVARQVDQVQHPVDAFGNCALTQPLHVESIGDVLVNREMRKECIALKDHGHVALVRRQRIDLTSIQKDLARGGKLEPGQHAQRGRLPTARRTQQRDQLSFLDLEVHIVNRSDLTDIAPCRKHLADVLQR